MSNILAMLFLLIMNNLAFSQERYSTEASFSGDKGNGGDGLVIDNKPYLYDLVEAGVHKNPFFDSRVTSDSYLKGEVENIFFHAPHINTDLITRKLMEVYNTDKVFGISLLYAMKFYSWRWVDLSLYDIPDDGDTVIRYDRNKLVQLAVRYNRSITVDVNHWNNLNPGNQVALIFHEAIYALMKPKIAKGDLCTITTTPYTHENQTKCNISFYEQNANLARQITGYLFTGELRKGRAALGKFIKDDLPNSMWFLEGLKSEAHFFKELRSQFKKLGVESLGLKGASFYVTPHMKLRSITGPRHVDQFSHLWGHGKSHYLNMMTEDKYFEKTQSQLCSDLSSMNNRTANTGIELLLFKHSVHFTFEEYLSVDGEMKSYISFNKKEELLSFNNFGVDISTFGYITKNLWLSMTTVKRDIEKACKNKEILMFLNEVKEELLKNTYWLINSKVEV
ncbi:MAG: hypothetical protein QF441_09415 [Bacteriovoracaceae bacterium]|jgi:hypothetical protein|nr:hypothetical protein [Bacteriovoracaceae bacterium]